MKNIIAVILAGAAGTVFAASADDTTRTTTANTAVSDYNTAKAKCDTMSGHAKTICVDEAKANRAHAEADAIAQSNVSERKRAKAQMAAVNADYALAKAKCADQSGSERSTCLKNAKAAHTTALASVKANRNVAGNTAILERNSDTANTTTTNTTTANTTPATTATGQVVDNAANRTAQATTRAGEVVADSVITTKVKADLIREKNLSASDIHVDTNNGVVMLSGFVNSRNEADKAVELARTVNGVKEVKSAIKVK